MMTNTKSFSVQIILSLGLLTGSMHSDLSLPALTECYQGADSSFKYLEFIFVEQPKNTLKAKAQQSQATMLVAVTAAILGTNWISATPASDGLKITASTMSIGMLSKVMYDAYSNYLEQNVKHDTLVKFLKNWNFHREYIPAQLIPAFDELAKALALSKSKTLTTAQVSEIFSVIQHLIEHEFAKRYEKDKMKDTDTLGMIKTITDISKNLKG